MKNIQKLMPMSVAGLFLCLTFTGCDTEDVTLPDASTVTATISATPTTVAESNGTSAIKISLSGYAFAPTTVALSFAGMATKDVDYSVSSTTVTIAPGAKDGTVTLKSLPDGAFEDDETVQVSIASVQNAVSDGKTATITIKEGLANNPLIINEVLYDPSNTALQGDANGDGVYNQDQDEFIELVNTSTESIDISNYKIYDATALTNATPRHIFPAGTVIPAGKAIVVFGGGKPTGTFGGSIVQTASSGLLNLNNDVDFITINDRTGKTILTFDIAPLSGNPNESYTRNPDITGDFVLHSAALPNRLFSPGTKINLSNF